MKVDITQKCFGFVFFPFDFCNTVHKVHFTPNQFWQDWNQTALLESRTIIAHQNDLIFFFFRKCCNKFLFSVLRLSLLVTFLTIWYPWRLQPVENAAGAAKSVQVWRIMWVPGELWPSEEAPGNRTHLEGLSVPVFISSILLCCFCCAGLWHSPGCGGFLKLRALLWHPPSWSEQPQKIIQCIHPAGKFVYTAV